MRNGELYCIQQTEKTDTLRIQKPISIHSINNNCLCVICVHLFPKHMLSKTDHYKYYRCVHNNLEITICKQRTKITHIIHIATVYTHRYGQRKLNWTQQTNISYCADRVNILNVIIRTIYVYILQTYTNII